MFGIGFYLLSLQKDQLLNCVRVTGQKHHLEIPESSWRGGFQKEGNDVTRCLSLWTWKIKVVLSQKGEDHCGDRKGSVPQPSIPGATVSPDPMLPAPAWDVSMLGPQKPCHLKLFLSSLSFGKVWGSGASEWGAGTTLLKDILKGKAEACDGRRSRGPSLRHWADPKDPRYCSW